MKENIPNQDETEQIRAFLNETEAALGIPEMQRKSPLLIGLLERHFALAPQPLTLRRNGRGQMMAGNPNRAIFWRRKESMPSQESIVGKDLELIVDFIPTKGTCFIALLPVPTHKGTKTYNKGPIKVEEILPTLDEFLEKIASDEMSSST